MNRAMNIALAFNPTYRLGDNGTNDVVLVCESCDCDETVFSTPEEAIKFLDSHIPCADCGYDATEEGNN